MKHVFELHLKNKRYRFNPSHPSFKIGFSSKIVFCLECMSIVMKIYTYFRHTSIKVLRYSTGKVIRLMFKCTTHWHEWLIFAHAFKCISRPAYIDLELICLCLIDSLIGFNVVSAKSQLYNRGLYVSGRLVVILTKYK